LRTGVPGKIAMSAARMVLSSVSTSSATMPPLAAPPITPTPTSPFDQRAISVSDGARPL
jgi:hypothetical protein